MKAAGGNVSLVDMYDPFDPSCTRRTPARSNPYYDAGMPSIPIKPEAISWPRSGSTESRPLQAPEPSTLILLGAALLFCWPTPGRAVKGTVAYIGQRGDDAEKSRFAVRGRPDAQLPSRY